MTKNFYSDLFSIYIIKKYFNTPYELIKEYQNSPEVKFYITKNRNFTGKMTDTFTQSLIEREMLCFDDMGIIVSLNKSAKEDVFCRAKFYIADALDEFFDNNNVGKGMLVCSFDVPLKEIEKVIGKIDKDKELKAIMGK